MPPAIPTLVINLDRDADRWAAISRRLEDLAFLAVTRIAGVYGKDLPAAARFALTRNRFWMAFRGELGCFLGHARAWEAVAEQATPCLVLEDDAIPVGLERLVGLPVPADADLVFVNDRMATGDAPSGDIPCCLPVTEAVQMLNRTGRGVGTDGYLLTPEGARRLLAAVERDLFFGHVDWRLLRYSLREHDFAGDLAGTRCEEIVRHHHNPNLPPQWGVLRSYCLDHPLVRIPDGPHHSSRIEANA